MTPLLDARQVADALAVSRASVEARRYGEVLLAHAAVAESVTLPAT